MMTAQRYFILAIFCLFIIGCAPNLPNVPPLVIPDAATPTAAVGEPTSAETDVTITQFGFANPPSKPSEASLLEWNVTGVDEVTITRTGGQWGEAGQQWRVPAAGSMVHTFADTLGGFEIMYRIEAVEGISAEFRIDLVCENEWRFDHPTSICPAAARESAGTQQNFENGIMLLIEAQNIVLFTTWNGQAKGVYEDSYDPSSDPLSADWLTPPNGFSQPEGNFGKIWRDNDDVRAALGWAIGPREDYTVVRQGEAASRTGVIREYISLADGSHIFIDQSVLVWDVTYPNPNVAWSGLRPPSTFDTAVLTTEAQAPSPEAVAVVPATPVPPAPTQPATVVPTSAPTDAPTATRVAPTAVVPTPTAEPTVAPTAEPTIAATAEPTTSGGVTVIQFYFDRQPTKPSDPVTLRWNISGVSSIHVERYGGEWGEANASFDLPAQGSMEQAFAPDVGGWFVDYVVTSSEAPDFEYRFSTTLPCEWEWLFDFPYSGALCPEQGVASNGSFQTFERGFMIWVESLDAILYSTWDGSQTNRVTDTFVHDVDPIKDGSIETPAGLFQPEYGFGKVWRERPGVRDMLGWGTDWSRSYTVLLQSEDFSRYGFTEYISMPGGLITINHPEPFWQIEYPR